MAKLIGELLFELARSLIADRINLFLKRVAERVCAWLDPKVHGRKTRIVVGLLLGVAAYVFFPLVTGRLAP
jgi:hypothetical protein